MDIQLAELTLPIITICILLGYQLSCYLLYQYFNNKSEKIGPNVLQLVYSLFFIFLNSGYLIKLLSVTLVEDPVISVILRVLTYILVLISLFVFLQFTAREPFHTVFNPKILKITSYLLVAPTTLLFIVGPEHIIFRIGLVVVPIAFLILFIFHIKLIGEFVGLIKRRIREIVIGGTLISVFLIFFEDLLRESLFGGFEQIALLIFAILYFAGILIMLNGIVNLPAILEFHWQDNLIKLSVVYLADLSELYTYQFISRRKIDFEDSNDIEDAFSEGILGIHKIVNAITSESRSKINSIEHGDYHILFEYGTFPINDLIFVLLVKKNTHSLQYFLNSIKDQFADRYSKIIPQLSLVGSEKSLFSNFDINVEITLKHN